MKKQIICIKLFREHFRGKTLTPIYYNILIDKESKNIASTKGKLLKL